MKNPLHIATLLIAPNIVKLVGENRKAAKLQIGILKRIISFVDFLFAIFTAIAIENRIIHVSKIHVSRIMRICH